MRSSACRTRSGRWKSPRGCGGFRYYLNDRFTYHPPKGNQLPRYTELREFALRLTQVCPASAELDRAIDKLDEVVMLANAAFARNE